jgi:hypothetical protein
MFMDVKPGIYRHFKGRLYEVLGPARHSETEELFVVYRALYGDGGTWIRPAAMFFDTIERDGVVQPRFAFVAEKTDAGHAGRNGD